MNQVSKHNKSPLDKKEINNESLLNALLEGMSDGAAVFVLDIDGAIVRMNQMAPFLLGVNQDALVRAKLLEVVSLNQLDGKPLDIGLNPIYRVLTEGYHQVQPFFCLYKKKDLPDPLMLVIRVVPILEDKTRIGAVAYLREAKRQIDPKNIDRSFVSFAAHQLKTPAGVVRGFLEMILKNPQTEAEPHRPNHRYLTAAYEANLSLIRTAKDLLNSAKLHGGLIEPEVRAFNLLETLSQKLVGYEQWLKNKQIKLVTHYELGKRPMVFSDQAIVAELFDIVFHNAVKYTPPGGEIEVAVSRSGPIFQISVTDNGPGFGVSDFEFEAAEVTSDSGSGVGLKTASEYAALLKGKLLRGDVKPNGARVVLQLPDLSWS